MITKIFVNLPVQDLKRSMAFFSSLGFTLNKQFTNENAACLVISDEIYAMLLVKKFFKTFIKKEIADSTKTTETILALACESREEVDALLAKALAAGAKEYREVEDQGWMYGRSFEDLDGHLWEAGYMDPAHVEPIQ
jgi:predicted lactoylglutathione lyase